MFREISRWASLDLGLIFMRYQQWVRASDAITWATQQVKKLVRDTSDINNKFLLVMSHIKWRKSLTRQTLIRPGYEILKHRAEGKIGYWALVTDKICTASLIWEYCVLFWRRLTFLELKDAHTHIHAHTHVHAVSNTHTHTQHAHAHITHTEVQSRSYTSCCYTITHTHTHSRSHNSIITHAHTHRGSVSIHVHGLEVNKALRTDVAPTNNSIKSVSLFVEFCCRWFPSSFWYKKKLPINLYPISRNA